MANAHVKYPSVYLVDGGPGFPPPLPPKPGQKRIPIRRKRLMENLLLVLVCLALGGLLVEGFLIYRLHNAANSTESDSGPVMPQAQKGGHAVTIKPRPPAMLNPFKPLAHLTDARKPAKEGVMKWNQNDNSILYKLKYKDGKLIVPKEGYYYVYSKLSYSADARSFVQTVEKNTTRLLGKSITLLRYSRYNTESVLKGNVRDSFLAGIFYLFKDDELFVRINNIALIRLYDSADNFFGIFML